jgi:hypothetical protein
MKRCPHFNAPLLRLQGWAEKDIWARLMPTKANLSARVPRSTALLEFARSVASGNYHPSMLRDDARAAIAKATGSQS